MKAARFNRSLSRSVDILRRSHGFTFAELGSALGVSWQQAQKYCAGRNAFAAHQIPILAEMFGLSVEQLYKEAGVKSPESEPTEAQNDAFLAARYVSRIHDGKLRRHIIDFTRKLAYEGAKA